MPSLFVGSDVDIVRMEIILRETKNGEPRKVPLNSVTEEVVFRLLEKAKAENHKYLFTNPETGKKDVSILRSWATACRLAEITDLHFHDLRHTFGTRAIENGATLPEVKEVMGHKSSRLKAMFTPQKPAKNALLRQFYSNPVALRAHARKEKEN